MSKRLTEEAMAYFDECVSISTFDGSDLSSQEDQTLSIDAVATPVDNYLCLNHASVITSATDSSSSCFKGKKVHSKTLVTFRIRRYFVAQKMIFIQPESIKPVLLLLSDYDYPFATC